MNSSRHKPQPKSQTNSEGHLIGHASFRHCRLQTRRQTSRHTRQPRSCEGYARREGRSGGCAFTHCCYSKGSARAPRLCPASRDVSASGRFGGCRSCAQTPPQSRSACRCKGSKHWRRTAAGSSYQGSHSKQPPGRSQLSAAPCQHSCGAKGSIPFCSCVYLRQRHLPRQRRAPDRSYPHHP